MAFRAVSGIQPTGFLTLGNYLGAIREFLALQESGQYELFVFVADLHAITLKIDPNLKKNIQSLIKVYLACGLDPAKTHLFVQSQIPEHIQLAKILESFVSIGELERMTQFKEKKEKAAGYIPASLLNYPILMAADILLYDARFVPVGLDQVQHLELTRNIAERANAVLGDIFAMPEPLVNKNMQKIYSLQSPTKKMSKSEENPKEAIFLSDEPAQAKNKILRAITDSDTKIIFDRENKPGISNLLTIYSGLTGIGIAELESRYQNSDYAGFKQDLGGIVADFLDDLQKKINAIGAGQVNEVLASGYERCSKIAQAKMRAIYKRIGLYK
jgi:tryptophanyl-tRNA synthetase